MKAFLVFIVCLHGLSAVLNLKAISANKPRPEMGADEYRQLSLVSLLASLAIALWAWSLL